ncbi:hypothetical protein LINPERPRIM_LOCUS23743 [Linum perenne]
MFRGDH